eukprot:365711-Chlamydomonas_euryale.AAC.8
MDTLSLAFTTHTNNAPVPPTPCSQGRVVRMHKAVQVGKEGSQRPPGRTPRMRPHHSWADRGRTGREDGLARQRPWGLVSIVLGPHVPVGSIYC